MSSCIRWPQAIRALVAIVVNNYVRFTLNEALLNSVFDIYTVCSHSELRAAEVRRDFSGIASLLFCPKSVNSCIRWPQAIRALVAIVVYDFVRFTLI